MPVLEDIQAKKTELIRKITAASLFIAAPTAPLPTTLTTGPSADLTALPSEIGPPEVQHYREVGLVTKDDGYNWGRETEMAETTSHGFVDPTRRDILRTTNTVAFTAQETSKVNLEMFRNVDLSSVIPTAVTGEVSFPEPLSPTTRYYRCFAIGSDGIGAGRIYVATLYPRAMVSEFGEQGWNDENEVQYPFTLTATPDTTAGYSVKHFFGGPGWRALLSAMGFPAMAA